MCWTHMRELPGRVGAKGTKGVPVEIRVLAQVGQKGKVPTG